MQVTVPISACDEQVTVELPESLIAKAVAHGLKQKVNDSYANVRRDARAEAKLGKKDEDTDEIRDLCRETANAVISDLESGIWREGGGGKRVSVYERALRDLVAAKLVKIGYAATDAAKAARDPRDAFKAYVEEYLEINGLDHDAKLVFDHNWPKIEASARDIAAQFEDDEDTKLDVDLS